MKKDIILIGGGGHCHSVIDAIESNNQFNILGILDKQPNPSSKIFGYDILGDDNIIPDLLLDEKVGFIITVGQILSATIRIEIANKIPLDRFVSIISNHAYISKYATIGYGSVVLHGAVVNAGTIIGNHCIINTLSNVEHDAIVGDFTHISTGAMINGNCKVGRSCFIGSNATLSHGISISDNKIISANSFVKTNL